MTEGNALDGTLMTFIVLLIVGIFVVDFGRRWWRQNEWKRRLSKPDDET